jgi:hypothetical protein
MTIRLKPEVVVITLTNLHHEVGHDLERPFETAFRRRSMLPQGERKKERQNETHDALMAAPRIRGLTARVRATDHAGTRTGGVRGGWGPVFMAMPMRDGRS